jgi:DNA mismatch repair protein MutS
LDKVVGAFYISKPMAKKKEPTPLMKQYWGVKSAHPDKIVLFRMGDFFEMFHEDATTAAPLLGIALTVRNKKSGDQTPMCGVPHHSIAGQINKLLEAGKKVAICDQVEDPKLAKGLVKREVTRVLTPGMVFDPETLDAQAPNYLMAFDAKTLSFMDSTTGECFYYLVQDEKRKKQLIETLAPVEIVLNEASEAQFFVIKPETWSGVVSFHEGLLNDDSLGPLSARRLLSYAQAMQGEEVIKALQPFEKRDSDFRMQISANVFRHLEVFKTYKGEKQGSLFYAINRTKTAGGARRLKSWLQFPLTDKDRIQARLERVEKWTGKLEDLKSLRQTLFKVGDLERRLGKVSQPHSHPRDLRSLSESLGASLELLPSMEAFPQKKELHEKLTPLRERLDSAFVEEIPNQFRDGGFIAKGFHAALDELIDVASNSQEKVRALEAREKELTGIQSLKVRYNNVFGYYIEVTNTHQSKVPTDRYQRKQTLTNAERYVTDELSELEKKVITAKTKRADLELEILSDLKRQVQLLLRPLLTLADQVNQLDVLSSLAWLALENSYVKPELIEEGAFVLEGCRHPVVEQMMTQNFVPNDVSIQHGQSILLTGPNMAGKSTLMRQVALCSLLAQMGSFVPARQARLPVVDKIFTRIGASDFLTEGLSTFMVEMQETAEMLNEATPRSLVILDEVGRGTSTYDGMSLAQSILEYFIRKLKSYTLFATHYHELTQLVDRYPETLINKHMAISDKKGEIHFRYHLADGPAQKSYGIQVARLAGLPKEVIQYAAQILDRLEARQGPPGQLDLWQAPAQKTSEVNQSEWLDDLKSLEIQKLTPLDALNTLAKWQQDLS